MQRARRVGRAVEVLSSRVAQVDLVNVDDGAGLLVRAVVDNRSVGTSRRDGVKRQALEVLALLPEVLELRRDVKLVPRLALVEHLLQPGKVAHERGAVADVALAEALDLGRVLARLGVGDVRAADLELVAERVGDGPAGVGADEHLVRLGNLLLGHLGLVGVRLGLGRGHLLGGLLDDAVLGARLGRSLGRVGLGALGGEQLTPAVERLPHLGVLEHDDVVRVEVVADLLGNGGGVGEQRRVVLRHDGVCEEHGVVGDVAAAQVEQPRDLVEGRHDDTGRAGARELVAQVAELVRDRVASKLVGQLEDGLRWASGTVSPDEVDEVLLDGHELAGLDLGEGLAERSSLVLRHDARVDANARRGAELLLASEGCVVDHGPYLEPRLPGGRVGDAALHERPASDGVSCCASGDCPPPSSFGRLDAADSLVRQLLSSLEKVAAVSPAERLGLRDDSSAGRAGEAGEPCAAGVARGEVLGCVCVGGQSCRRCHPLGTTHEHPRSGRHCCQLSYTRTTPTRRQCCARA